jgi:hypothetical protein
MVGPLFEIKAVHWCYPIEFEQDLEVGKQGVWSGEQES